MKDFEERITYLLGMSGVHGATDIEGVFKDAEHNAFERGRGDFYPVNLCYEITSTAISEIAPGMLRRALEDEADDAARSCALYGLGSKIAEKLFFHDFDGLDAWHNGARQVIARRVAEACAALGLEIDEDDVDASGSVADAIQNAADQLGGRRRRITAGNPRLRVSDSAQHGQDRPATNQKGGSTMKDFKMRYQHADFNTWRLAGGNAEHLAGLTGKAAFDALESAMDAEEALDALNTAACEFMFNCEVEKDAAQGWGLQYDGDACGGDGGYVDEDGDEYININEHSSAGGWVRDAVEEFEEAIARELFAEALLSGGQELERAAIWAGLVRDRGGMRVYEEFNFGGSMYPGEAIITAAKEAGAEHLNPKTVVALGAFLDSDESEELIEIIKNKRAQMNTAKALEARPGYAMQRYRDRAAELVAALRDARGWVVLEADTNGRVINRTQCKTKADALREARRQALYLARQATREFAEYGSAYID